MSDARDGSDVTHALGSWLISVGAFELVAVERARVGEVVSECMGLFLTHHSSLITHHHLSLESLS